VPLSPLWGQVRPWFMETGDQFRPPPPPSFGSTEFLVALADVRAATDGRTPEQLAIARYWGATTNGGPAGLWSDVAFELASSEHFGERRMARLLAVMHMAEMDATIGCWDAKYAYWFIRPFQADPAITTPVGRPNFPAYPSAHSCISASLAGVLMAFFPSATSRIEAMVEEAGEARIYAGLHYRFDVEAGQALGYDVAKLAVARTRGAVEPVVPDR
jgi:hypothetical protein